MKRHALILLLLAVASPNLLASDPAGFDFEFGEFPGDGILDSGRRVEPKGEFVRTGADPLGERKGKVCLTEDASRGGVFVRPESKEGDPLGGALSALTVCLSFEASPVSASSIFLERLVAGSSATPGFFRFGNQSNTGDDLQRTGTLRFYAFNEKGQPVVATSTEPWVQDEKVWHWVACVIEPGRVTFYLDGDRLGDPVEIDLQGIAAAGDQSYFLRAGYGFLGAFDDLLVVPNQALTGEQLQLVRDKGMTSLGAKLMLK